MVKSISILYRKTQIYLNEQAESLAIGSGKVPFIMCVTENPGISQNRMACLLNMDKSTVTKMLARLEQEGYITRKVNHRDSRSFNIFPTEKARAAYPKITAIEDRWCEEMTKGLTPIERSIFTELLSRVVRNVSCYFETGEHGGEKTCNAKISEGDGQ